MKRIKRLIISILTSLIVLFNCQVLASPSEQIQIVGLFKNAAVLNINNERKLIRVGSTSGNVRLLAANSDKAMLEVAGRRYIMTMADNASIRVGLPSTSQPQAQLISNGGMYNITGFINQQSANFVVDTGATYITMNAKQASRLGIDYSKANKISMQTAKGKADAYIITIKSVRVGGIELNDIKAAVVKELDTDKMLLGMSFLGKVEMQQKNGFMILKKNS